MGTQDIQLDEIIRSMVPINSLDAQYQKEIINQTKIVDLYKGQYAFKEGDKDNYSFYLLQGELHMHTGKRLVKRVIGGTDAARHALAQLQPRQLAAMASSQVKLARVDRSLLDKLLVLGEDSTGSKEMVVNEIESTESGDWMTRILQSELFGRIPAVNIQQIFAKMEPVVLREQDTVIRQGEPGDYYYIIQSGRCEVTRRTSAASQDIKLAELSAGDSFGEEALLSDKPRNATITMLTSGNLMRLTKQAFDELIKRPALNGVSYEQAQQMAAKGAIWLDVRFPDEHKDLVISKSENIPLYVLRMEIGRLPQDKSYIVFCDSGTRSSVGAFLLTQRGFDVCYLEGGIINSPIASKLESASIPPAEEHPEAVLPPSASEANTETATTLSKTVEKTPDTSISLPSPKTAAFISALKKEVIKTRLRLKQALKLKTEAQESKRFIVRKLKAEFEKLLAKERQHHQEELTQLKQQLERAKEWQKSAKGSRGEVVAKAEKMIAEFEESQAELLREEQSKLDAERKELQKERQKLEKQEKMS